MFSCKGTGPTGADEIKAHRFFKGIDWTKLARKEISAPFKPNIQHELDTSNFSDDFTKMAVIDQPCKPPPNHERLFRGNNSLMLLFSLYFVRQIDGIIVLIMWFKMFYWKVFHSLRLIYLTMTMCR